MSETQDIDGAESDGGELDPREAATLLAATRRRAERRLDFRSPWLSLVGAGVVLAAFGAVWLSVRGQHPYTGPTAAGLGVMYLILVAWIVLVVAVTRRATTGVSGRSIRQQRGYAAAVVTALIAVSVVQGALKYQGVGRAIVYGIYPPTAQLIVLAAIATTVAAGREDWPGFGAGIGVALVAAGSAFAGPAGVWLSDGLGCAAVVLAYSAAQRWVQHRDRRRA